MPLDVTVSVPPLEMMVPTVTPASFSAPNLRMVVLIAVAPRLPLAAAAQDRPVGRAAGIDVLVAPALTTVPMPVPPA